MPGDGGRLRVPLTGARLVAVPLVATTLAAGAVMGVPAAPGHAQILPPILPGPEPPRPAGADNRPNVLIIVTDDQRADSLDVMTRTLRWFGSGGVTFANAYATTPLCCPSRASIMTGQYAHNHGVHTNLDAHRLPQRATLQRYLQEEGYLTAIAGKYLNDWWQDPPYFDEWTIFAKKRGGYYGSTYNSGGVMRRVDGYSTDFIAAEAIRFLRGFEQLDGRPWLLYVTPYAPHAPQQPARRHLGSGVPPFRASPSVGERDRTDKPAWLLGKRLHGGTLTHLLETRAGQIRTLRAADELVDSVMKALGALEEAGRTMAFFLSDNGYLWGEHGLKQKRAPYTPSVRIPFMLRWPGHVAGGQTVGWPVATIDIVPTVFDAVGITPDPQYPVDGLHLLGPSRERLLLELYRERGRRMPTWASTRTGTYQYTEWYRGSGRQVRFREYYDLRADPWQLRNVLADADPFNDPPLALLAQLSAQLARERRCAGTPDDPAGRGSPPCP